MTPAPHRWILLALIVGWGAAGCEDHEFHPLSQEEKLAQADSAYSTELFDSVTWGTHSERIQAGNLVFADECRRCHGPLGRGGTEYARGNELDVPSLVQPEWPYAGSIDSVRYRTFVGHISGMPNWGVGRLTPRQIDAAAAYILHQLRPEVLGAGTRLPVN